MPVDAVVAERIEADAPTRVVTVQEIPPGWMGLDIGPASVSLFTTALSDAGTVVWNGPMGVFEVDAFAEGTVAIARALAGSPALTILGGGDTDAAVRRAGVADRMSYISTGGGAFLELLEGRELPGLAALTDKSRA